MTGTCTNTHTDTHAHIIADQSNETQLHVHIAAMYNMMYILNVFENVNQASVSYSKTQYLHIKQVRCGCDIPEEEPIFLCWLSVRDNVTGNTQSPETHHFQSAVLSAKYYIYCSQNTTKIEDQSRMNTAKTLSYIQYMTSKD